MMSLRGCDRGSQWADDWFIAEKPALNPRA